MSKLNGGCQCGAVRFRIDSLGRASICHCRMCQKQFGSFFGPFVTAHGLKWTRGEPKRFKSSNKASRGFCSDCGTPLTYEVPGNDIEIAIGALDNPRNAAPAVQVNPSDRLPFVDDLPSLPTRLPDGKLAETVWDRSLVSYQHPDHDTDGWPPEGGFRG